jgi:hypothetical protein
MNHFDASGVIAADPTEFWVERRSDTALDAAKALLDAIIQNLRRSE